MGICASSNLAKQGARMMTCPTTTKVIHVDGSHQEFRHPIKAIHVLSQNPDCFLCCSESMYVNSRAPHVAGDEELQLGQIYFLLPLSKSESPLSLQDLCALAIKATAGGPLLVDHVIDSAKMEGFCRTPANGFAGVIFPVAQGGRGIYE